MGPDSVVRVVVLKENESGAPGWAAVPSAKVCVQPVAFLGFSSGPSAFSDHDASKQARRMGRHRRYTSETERIAVFETWLRHYNGHPRPPLTQRPWPTLGPTGDALGREIIVGLQLLIGGTPATSGAGDVLSVSPGIVLPGTDCIELTVDPGANDLDSGKIKVGLCQLHM